MYLLSAGEDEYSGRPARVAEKEWDSFRSYKKVVLSTL